MHDIDAFVDGQLQAGLAVATTNRRVAALKAFFDFLAEEEGDLTWPNPVRSKRRFPILRENIAHHSFGHGSQFRRDAVQGFRFACGSSQGQGDGFEELACADCAISSAKAGPKPMQWHSRACSRNL